VLLFRWPGAASIRGSALLGIWLVFAVLKVTSVWGKPPQYSGDGRIWAEIALSPWFSRDFLLPRRPILYPLFFKVFGEADAGVIITQLGISIVAWGVFALVLSRLVRAPAAAVVVFALTLFGALASSVHGWDSVIRSESTATSCLMLTLAGMLTLLREAGRPSKRMILLTSAAGLLAAFSRDANAYILCIAGVAMGVHALWEQRAELFPLRHTLVHSRLAAVMLVATTLVVSGCAAQVHARVSHRYEFSLMNVIFKRILTHRGKLAFFRNELGMPVSRALMTRRGKFASSDQRLAFRAPELESFRTWLRQDGYRAYQKYLLSHPVATFEEAYKHLGAFIANDSRREGRAAQTALTPLADEWYVQGPLTWRPLLSCFGLLLVGSWALFDKNRKTRLSGMWIYLALATVVSQMYICYHADSMEVQRHALIVGIFFRLAFVGAVAVLLSKAFDRRAVADPVPADAVS